MAESRNTRADYRALKKELNRYFDFTFRMPPKGRDFSPQQKSAITRKYRRIKKAASSDVTTYLPYPKHSKLPGIDGIRTDKGLFYKFPEAKLRYDKKARRYRVAVAPKPPRGAFALRRRLDIFYPFPPHIRFDLPAIRDWVEALKEAKRPDEIRWSIADRRQSTLYDPDIFDFYFTRFVVDESDQFIDDELLSDEEVKELPGFIGNKVWRKRKFSQTGARDPEFYNGVFLIYYTINKR